MSGARIMTVGLGHKSYVEQGARGHCIGAEGGLCHYLTADLCGRLLQGLFVRGVHGVLVL